MSAAPQLVLPKRFASRYQRAKTLIGSFRKDTYTSLKEHPGRPVGKPHGTWVGELVALRKASVLCWSCQHKFNHKRNHYYKDMRFDCHQGLCDGCRTWACQGKLYVHESSLAEPGGRLMSGQVVTPV